MSSTSSARRRLLNRSTLAIAAVALASGSAHASSLLEIYGTVGAGGGTVTGQTYGISWRADKLEWTLGTYAHSGGTLPSGGTIPGGGIDAALSAYTEDGATLLATNDNLSATNKDAEIHTTTVTGRTGSATVTPSSWTGGYKWTMSTPAGASLGNGKFAVVSYLPNDSLQYLENLSLSSGAALTGIYGTNSRVWSPSTGTMAISDRLKLTASSSLDVGNGSVKATNVTMENSTININGSGFLESDNVDFGGASNDRSTISITGTGGIKAQSMYMADDPSAAVTIEQRNGLVDVQSMGFKWVNIPPTTNISHYYLYGGTLKVRSLVMKDAILHVAGGRLEGSYLFSQSVDKQDTELNSRISWESGTIAFTGESATTLSTGSFFGSTIALTAGKAIELNAPGLTSFVNLSGGKLALRELADDGLKMDWQSGELQVTGTGATTLATGKALGNQLTLRSGMTLRTGGFLNVDAGSRLLLNDGGRAIVTGMNNKGEIRFSGNGDGWLENGGTNGITNTGLITGAGRIAGWIGNDAAGRVEVGADQDLRIVGGLVNAGTVRLTGGQLTVTTSFTNNATGKFTGRGTISGASLDNSGVFTLAGGLSDVDIASVRNRSGGKTIVTGAANAIFYGNVVNDTGSEFNVAADSRATFLGNVSGANAFTGSGVKVFQGTVTGGMIASDVGSSIVESGGSLDVAGIRETSLTLRGSASLATNSGVSKLNAITFDGGSLDLRNNSLVIDYSSASPIDAIRNALSSGKLNSSSLQNGRVIALLDGASFGRTSLGGVAIDSSSLILSLALRGDADVDGSVAFTDLLALAKNYNQSNRTWSQGDFDADGKVNFTDLLTLAKNYGQSVRSADAQLVAVGADDAFRGDFALAMSIVPEPTSLSLLGFAAALGLRRRGR